MRKFAIPFDGSDPNEYFENLKPFIPHIDNVYLGIPSLIHCSSDVTYENSDISYILKYEQNCYRFLELTKNAPYKRLLTINCVTYEIPKSEKELFVITKLKPLVEFYNIQGVIMADFEFACAVHDIIPNLEIQTSCNTFMWNLREMQMWKERCGVITFNPPREILRTPDKLKEMHDAGFKIKAICNENCIYGCPACREHNIHVGNKFRGYRIYCENNFRLTNLLKGTYIIPRWMKELDPYVDVYKLVGRRESRGKKLFDFISLWINEDNEANLSEIKLTGKMNKIAKEMGVDFSVKYVPDKLLTCQCLECDSCNICDKIMEKQVKKLYNDGKINKKYTLDYLLSIL